jgi:hypothetical protein
MAEPEEDLHLPVQYHAWHTWAKHYADGGNRVFAELSQATPGLHRPAVRKGRSE